MIPVETIPGMGWGGDKGQRVEGVNSSIIYLIHCKNFCKHHTVTPSSTTIKTECYSHDYVAFHNTLNRLCDRFSYFSQISNCLWCELSSE
jgi:hypothetical protein